MNVTSTQLAVPPMHSLDAAGGCAPTSASQPPVVLLLYGEERANAALADELTLDGYEVRRASDPAGCARRARPARSDSSSLGGQRAAVPASTCCARCVPARSRQTSRPDCARCG